MQVARAAGALPQTNNLHGVSKSANNTYAPLYLTSSLRDMAFDIEELEGIALDRLKLLKKVETLRSSFNTNKGATSYNAFLNSIRSEERNFGLRIESSGDRESGILKDEASHFLLRLALCKNREHQNWLLATELDLFNSRLVGSGVDFELRAIEKANGPVVRRATQAELDRFRAELDAVARGPCRQRGGDEGTAYYKVSFEEVPALVRQRKVFLHLGVAFVPERQVLDIVAGQFRTNLSKGLRDASKAVAFADEDRRMHPILESIRQHHSLDEQAKGFDPSQGIERISLTQLNESVSAMPLCMSNMMAKLREQHHLRYTARLQLGVFLKGCGLTMDESLRFWKAEFGKGAINAEKFEKNYAYNIRHHYGKEGKRRNLPPFECMRVIYDRPGPGEHHGCPYREFEENRLRTALRSIGTDPNQIPSITAKAKEGNYQIACGMCFAASQPGRHPYNEHGFPAYVPSHPNEYFIEARRRRFAPQVDVPMLDDDIEDEDMLAAASAFENQASSSSQPSVPVTPDSKAPQRSGLEAPAPPPEGTGSPKDGNGKPNQHEEEPVSKESQDVDMSDAVPMAGVNEMKGAENTNGNDSLERTGGKVVPNDSGQISN